MDAWTRITIKYGGRFEGSKYKGGDEKLGLILESILSLSSLRATIETLTQIYPRRTPYLLYSLELNQVGRLVKSLMMSNDDLHRLIKLEADPTVCVDVEFERRCRNKFETISKQFNPRTVTYYRTGVDNHFEYVFVTWGPCINVFMFNLRKVIVVDDTHLKGKSIDILFILVTKDCNEKVLPLAIEIGPIENNDSWTWFMSKLRAVYPPNGDQVTVSDQHASFKHVAEEVYLEASHCLCTAHLAKNLAPYGERVIKRFRKAATAYTKSEFQRIMVSIKEESAEAYDKLMELGPE